MNNPYIISENSITVMHEGQPYTVLASDSLRFKSVKQAIIEGDWELVHKELNIVSAINEFSNGELVVDNGEVFYDGEKLHGRVVEYLLDFIYGDGDYKPLENFIVNLLGNPSKSSVDELYDFLAHKNMPIDDEGYVLAYKGVDSNFMSIAGNTSTKVLEGIVDAEGRIYNGIGETVEVERRHVDDNRNNGCSHGLHVGSYKYASDWGEKVVLVRFNPRDAVSVPLDCSCQKLRVCKYEVVKEVDSPQAGSYYSAGNAVPWDDEEATGYYNIRDSKGRFTKKE